MEMAEALDLLKKGRGDVTFAIDFDSTLSGPNKRAQDPENPKGPTGEQIDDMAIALGGAELLRKIKVITDLGMNGDLGFSASLARRMDFLTRAGLNRRVISGVSADLLLPPTIAQHREVIEELARERRLIVLTGGFHDIVDPFLERELGITPELVFANRLLLEGDRVVGVEEGDGIQDDGKNLILRRLKKKGVIKDHVIIWGDGDTDRSTLVDRQGNRGEADAVVIATHVVHRPTVIEPPTDPRLRERFRVAATFEEAVRAFRKLIQVITGAA